LAATTGTVAPLEGQLPSVQLSHVKEKMM